MRLAACGAGEFALATDPDELADELDPASCRRLLGFLLGFCRSAFALSSDPGFAASCLRLARRCAREGGPASPVAMATTAWTLLSGVRAPSDATLYILGSDHVRHSAAPVTADGSGLQLTARAGAGDVILALCDEPLLWVVQAGAARLPDLLAPEGAGSKGLMAVWRSACLRGLASTGGAAAAMVEELQVRAPATARRHDDPASAIGAALDVAVPDGEGGLFLRGWMRDPMNLVAGAELRTPYGAASVDPSRLHRIRRPDLVARFARAAFRDGEPRPGFIAHLPDPSGGLFAQPTLALRLRSGNVIEVSAALQRLPAAAARDAVLSCIAPDEVTPAMLGDCLVPAAAALHRRAMAGRGVAEVVQIGPAVRLPAISVIVPLYRNLDFLRFQVAAFAADPECRQAELIYVLDSPEQRAETEHMLRGLMLLHRLSFMLVVMPRNLGYAAASNTAAGLARGPCLLLLNSDVVPARPGWLVPMRAALAAPGAGAAGPKLLFDDGSIQHAGLYFARDAEGIWFNAHYHKGMPRHWPAAQLRRRVPGVTGAALLVRRALFEAVGGFCEDYIIGDYEDSDLCLRIRETGAAIAYVPEAELYHFERRSIRLHSGYVRTLASLYNRRLHHGRWGGAMEALMARRAHRVAA